MYTWSDMKGKSLHALFHSHNQAVYYFFRMIPVLANLSNTEYGVGSYG